MKSPSERVQPSSSTSSTDTPRPRSDVPQYKNKCDICLASFKTVYLLSGHRKLHSGEKPYECDHCSQKFASKDYLGRHKGIQSDICHICHFWFFLVTRLRHVVQVYNIIKTKYLSDYNYWRGIM